MRISDNNYARGISNTPFLRKQIKDPVSTPFSEFVKENGIRPEGAGKVPYSYMAKDGVIEYNGVEFVCDEKNNAICLGDMTDEKNIITVSLSGGGVLKVNRNNYDDLVKAIGMFSPEDINRILYAITKDNMARGMELETEKIIDEVNKNLL